MQIALGVLSLIGAILFGKIINKSIQMYRSYRQRKEVEAVKIASEEENKKANLESDKLKEIDGR